MKQREKKPTNYEEARAEFICTLETYIGKLSPFQEFVATKLVADHYEETRPLPRSGKISKRHPR